MVTFDDIPADAVRALIASMVVSKQHCRSSDSNMIFKSMAPADIFGLLDFSSRLLMPWAGISYVREAVRDSTDAVFLFEVASKRALFDGTDEEAEWKEVQDLVCQRMALVVEEAAASPEFGQVGIEMLEHVVGYILDGEWSEETVHTFPCRDKVDCLRSQVNSQGFHMRIEEGQNGGDMGLYIGTRSNDIRYALTLSSCVIFVADYEIEAHAHIGENFKHVGRSAAFNATKPWGWGSPQFFSRVNEERFRHKGFYNLAFRTKYSKIQRQCLALVRFYEKTARNTSCVPPSSEQQWMLLHAWRYYSKAGNNKLADVLRDYVCKIFDGVDAPEFFRALTCSELESVLEQDLLATDLQEMRVLKVVIDWSRHRSNDTGGLKVGDEVRVKLDCKKNQGWRGEDCVVKGLLPGRKIMLVEHRIRGQPSLRTKTLGIAYEDVHNPASTGMMRLLVHVRHAFIPLLELSTQLSNEDIHFACKHKCFRDMVKKMIETQTSKLVKAPFAALQAHHRLENKAVPVAGQIKGRVNYMELAVMNPVQALTSALTHAGGLDILTSLIAQYIPQAEYSMRNSGPACPPRLIKACHVPIAPDINLSVDVSLHPQSPPQVYSPYLLPFLAPRAQSHVSSYPLTSMQCSPHTYPPHHLPTSGPYAQFSPHASTFPLTLTQCSPQIYPSYHLLISPFYAQFSRSVHFSSYPLGAFKPVPDTLSQSVYYLPFCYP
jgi:hypothetical protein